MFLQDLTKWQLLKTSSLTTTTLSKVEIVNKEPVGFEFSIDMHMFYVIGNCIYSFSSRPFMYYLFGRHPSFPLFMPVTLEIVHISVSIQNTNIHEVLGDSHKYFTFASYICPFTSMTTYAFLVSNAYCQDLHSVCMYAWCMKLHAYTYIHV